MKQAFELITRAQAERAYLVGVSLPRTSVLVAHEHLDELAQLAATAGAEVVGRTVQSRSRIDGSTYVGAGKVQQIKKACEEWAANLVIFDNDLSPAQAHKLEKELGVNVIDRTELILDIFARHAHTQQAMIQVELAQLEYALPRLTRLWDHLSRQSGGIGTKGPGETQLEVDRRKIRQRMASLKRELKKVGRQRATLRERRNGTPTVALIGYTNAGKSTLMRQLTGADVLIRDQLFATLDTTTRRITTERHGDIFVIDTVGFIRKLPDHLVTSFRATLEDTADADLFLHVVDLSHPSYEEQMDVTDRTVRSIGSNGNGTGETPIRYVFNKVDRVEPDLVEALRQRYPGAVFLSAKQGTGIEALREHVEKHFFARNLRVEVRVSAGDGRAIARIHGLLHEAQGSYDEDVCVLHGTIDASQMGRLEGVTGATIRYLM